MATSLTTLLNIQRVGRDGSPIPLDQILKNPATSAFINPIYQSIGNNFPRIKETIQTVREAAPNFIEDATRTMKLVYGQMTTEPLMPENRFVFELYYPEAVDIKLKERGIFNSPIISFTTMNTYIRSSQIPGKAIEAEPGRMYGLPRLFPTNLKYEHTFPLTFALSSDVRIRLLFDFWMNMVINPDTGDTGYYDEYARPFNFNIYGLDRHDDVIMAMGAEEVYPIEIGAINLDQNASNTFATFNVVLAYRKLFPFRAVTEARLPQSEVRAAIPFSSFASQKEYYLR
jgi:hypothetical protein